MKRLIDRAEFFICAILQLFYKAVFLESENQHAGIILIGVKSLCHIFKCKVLRQMVESHLGLTPSSAVGIRLIVHVVEILTGIFPEEVVLGLILDVQHQLTEFLVLIVDGEGLALLPLVPVAHQDKGGGNGDAVLAHSHDQQFVGLVLIDLG